MSELAEVARQVRQTIYEVTAKTGDVPDVNGLARRLTMDRETVASALQTLADLHVIVLQREALELWTAPPFSAVPTAFRVRSAARSWFAPCAWDAFGIPAALKQDVTIDACCAWTGEPLPGGVTNGRAYGAGVIHLEVPARRFWDDIFYT